MSAPRAFRRWLIFNLVGALGMAVQLGVLAALTGPAGMHYTPATAIAVEIAVLHNFLWHERWTWRDREESSRFTRLWRFHVANGLVSLVGNSLLMALFVGVLALPPVAANVLAIVNLSILNFTMSDRLVFSKSAPGE